MSDDRIRKLNNLAESLLRGTEAEQIHWDESLPGQFELVGRSGRILVSSETDSGHHPYILRIEAPDGRPVESVATLRGEFYHPWEQRLADLYQAARASARNVDGVIEAIRQEYGLEDAQVPARTSDEDADLPF